MKRCVLALPGADRKRVCPEILQPWRDLAVRPGLCGGPARLVVFVGAGRRRRWCLGERKRTVQDRDRQECGANEPRVHGMYPPSAPVPRRGGRVRAPPSIGLPQGAGESPASAPASWKTTGGPPANRSLGRMPFPSRRSGLTGRPISATLPAMRHFLQALVVSTALVSTAAAEPLSDVDRQRVLAHLAMTDAWLASEVAGLTAAQQAWRSAPRPGASPTSSSISPSPRRSTGRSCRHR